MRWGAPDIAFTGYLTGEELATAYASADLFVFPSRTDTFGNAVLEAMASGVAPVVACEGGPAEQICHGETGLIVDLDRREALADAIQALLGADDPHGHGTGVASIWSAARARATSCSWDRLLGALFPHLPAAQPPGDACDTFAGEPEEAIAAIG